MPPMYRNTIGLLLIPTLTLPWLAGCDSFHAEGSKIDGYWKGQMVESNAHDVAPDQSERHQPTPQRILMRLDNQSGTIQGEYAQSSDMVAFRRPANETSRRITKYDVSGTFAPPTLSLSFSGDEGQQFQVKASVDGKRITGTYVTTGDQTTTGTLALRKD